MTFFIFFYSSVSHMRVRITFIPSTHTRMHARTHAYILQISNKLKLMIM